MHADEPLPSRLHLAGRGAEQPQLGGLLPRPDVGMKGAAPRYGVVEIVEHPEAGVERRRRLPLVRAYEGVAPPDLVVMNPSEVGGDAAAGLGRLACLLVGLEPTDA